MFATDASKCRHLESNSFRCADDAAERLKHAPNGGLAGTSCRATQNPPRTENLARDKQVALLAFLDTAEAETQIENPLDKDEQDRRG